MQSEIEKRDTLVVYRPMESVLNASHTVQLKSDFAVLTHTTESKPVVVDLSQVRSVDSSVLSALLMLRRLLEGQGRSLAIVSDQDAVKSVFRLSKMDMIMPLLPTLEEALAYFSQQELALMPKKVEDEPETEEDFEEGDEEEWDEEWDEEDWEDEDWEDEEWEDEEWEDEDWEDEEAEEDEED
jgi:anti-anti-sigma factor